MHKAYFPRNPKNIGSLNSYERSYAFMNII